MRPVSGADLQELCTRASHDLRQAERTTDLDQFAARDDDLPAPRQRVEYEQQGCRVVVDNRRILGTGQFTQQAANVIVALATTTLGNLEFQGNGRSHSGDRR